jgi:hypothetical protein
MLAVELEDRNVECRWVTERYSACYCTKVRDFSCVSSGLPSDFYDTFEAATRNPQMNFMFRTPLHLGTVPLYSLDWHEVLHLKRHFRSNSTGLCLTDTAIVFTELSTRM